MGCQAIAKQPHETNILFISLKQDVQILLDGLCENTTFLESIMLKCSK